MAYQHGVMALWRDAVGDPYRQMDLLHVERYLQVPKLSKLLLQSREQKSLYRVSSNIEDQILFQYQETHSRLKVS
jgi:hypothetical protein